jgi:anthranilate phosphoribosyltransferase
MEPVMTPVMYSPETLAQQDWTVLLRQIVAGESLEVEQASLLMQGWLAEAIDPLLSGAILVALNGKGFSGVELAGMARVLKSLSSGTKLVHDYPLVDTCGTGGDGADTFNISTAVAFVVAAAGVKVAKHGGRSSSSRVGSADVLESMGVNFGADPARIRSAVQDVGVTFLFAPGWHPAMKAVAGMRKALKIRTVFNLLGPLVNPMNPTGQVIGVSDPKLLKPIAEALGLLGVDRGIVVYGREGLDEACLGDVNEFAVLRSGQVTLESQDPRGTGLATATVADLKGGDVAENAAILRSVLQGKGTSAQTDAVALNAALVLTVGEKVMEVADGVALARSVMQSGAAWEKLEALVAYLKA